MNKSTIFSFLLVLGMIMPLKPVEAQQKDFQIWASAGAEAELVKRLRLIADEEIRLKENATQMDKQINDLGLSYRLNKHVKVALYYRFEDKWKHPGEHYWKSGTYADLNLRDEKGRFGFGYRFRFQSARVDMNENQNMMSQWVSRHRFSIDYNIRHVPLTPFAEEELFYTRQYGEYGMSDYRTWIGMTYSPGKVHEFTLRYGIDHEKGVPDPLTSYILEFSYSLTFKP